jgi:hypothetical protein
MSELKSFFSGREGSERSHRFMNFINMLSGNFADNDMKSENIREDIVNDEEEEEPIVSLPKLITKAKIHKAM